MEGQSPATPHRLRQIPWELPKLHAFPRTLPDARGGSRSVKSAGAQLFARCDIAIIACFSTDNSSRSSARGCSKRR